MRMAAEMIVLIQKLYHILNSDSLYNLSGSVYEKSMGERFGKTGFDERKYFKTVFWL